MLDKSDLRQIRAIVQEETRAIVQKETRAIVQEELVPIKKELKTIKEDIIQIRKDQNAIIKFFDEEFLNLRQRVDRIEEVLHISRQ